MRVPYYCPYCNQRSTRRWNLDVHIKRKHGGYLLDRSSGRHMGSNPLSPNNPYHNIGSATIADSVDNTFEPTYLRHQTTLGISQYPTRPIHRPLPTVGTGLSQDTIQKIQELKRLLNKYPQYHNIDPDEIVRLVVYYCINGDKQPLDEKLEQLGRLEGIINT